jgi:hypothetical protein
MIVFELICPKYHRFEGWFASADDFSRQKGCGLLSCPTCGHTGIEKLPTAKIRKAEAEPAAPTTNSVPSSQQAPARPGVPTLHAAHMDPVKLSALLDHIIANTENVGAGFAAEARRIHNEDAPRRDIRGTATREETEELIEEGVPIMPLPIPPRGDWH